jgi:PRC-barrel domain protein
MTEKVFEPHTPHPARLCYLSADRVEGPLDTFDKLEVRGRENLRIGQLEGIIIDPAERRVRYLVVDEARFLRHHHYLLPLAPTQVDVEHHALRVDLDRDELDEVDEFDADTFPPFSDDDLIASLFARPSA